MFFVRKNTEVDISSKAPYALGKPGFKFKEWDTDITALNIAEDKTVTATYEATAKHKVVYEADGKLIGIEYLNNNDKPKEVPDKLPEKEGYKFVGWQKNAEGIVYLKSALEKLEITEDTRFVAKYEAEEAEQSIVTFEVSGVITHIEKVAKGGNIANVPSDPVPEAGMVFMGWTEGKSGLTYSKAATEALTINEDTAFKANFRDGSSILPIDPGEDPKPGYVKVTFKKGENGEKLEGNFVFQVKEDTEVSLEGVAPKAIPKEGYKFKAWDKALTGKFTADTDITATYEEKDDVIVIPDPENPGPPPTSDYVKVRFDKGEQGESLVGNTAFYVKKNKTVDLTDFAPVAVPKEGFKFTGWDSALKRAFTEDTVITAGYETTVLPKYDVTYEVGGILKHSEKVTKGESPKEVPDDPVKTGYEFKGWQIKGEGKAYSKAEVEALKITEATRFEAKFEVSEDIIPGEDPKPDGYITVFFNKGEGKALVGTTVFHVKKNTEVNLKAVAPTAIPQDGYKFTKWKDRKSTRLNSSHP
mgnify:CR=1 FL=1